jgi:hypothetical protein
MLDNFNVLVYISSHKEESMATNIEVVEKNQGFIRKKGSYAALVKRANKSLVVAMDVLESVLETTLDEKIKVASSKELAGISLQILDKNNTDEITRLIAEFKYVGGVNKSLTTDDGYAVIDFNTIQTD